MNNSDRQIGSPQASGFGTYLEEWGSTRAGLDLQDAKEPKKAVSSSESGALITGRGVGDFDALGVMDEESAGEGDGVDPEDGLRTKSHDANIEALCFLPIKLISFILHFLHTRRHDPICCLLGHSH